MEDVQWSMYVGAVCQDYILISYRASHWPYHPASALKKCEIPCAIASTSEHQSDLSS